MILSHFIAAAALLQATPSGAQSTDDAPIRRDNYSLAIPDQIAPAIIPYLSCLMASHGTPIPAGKGRLVINSVKTGGDCGAYRKSSFTMAYLLHSEISNASSSEREAYVESSLEDVERWVSSLPVVPEEAK